MIYLTNVSGYLIVFPITYADHIYFWHRWYLYQVTRKSRSLRSWHWWIDNDLTSRWRSDVPSVLRSRSHHITVVDSQFTIRALRASLTRQSDGVQKCRSLQFASRDGGSSLLLDWRRRPMLYSLHYMHRCTLIIFWQAKNNRDCYEA